MDSFRYFYDKTTDSILYGYIIREDSKGFRLYVANGDYYANYDLITKVLSVEETCRGVFDHTNVDLPEVTRDWVIKEHCSPEEGLESEVAVLERLTWVNFRGFTTVKEYFESLKVDRAEQECLSEFDNDDIPY